MKTDTLLIIVAAAVGLFVISRAVRAQGTGTVLDQSNKVSAIPNNALPGQPGWGWRYYSDGTAIGPDGRYYFQGAEVYDPAGMLKA